MNAFLNQLMNFLVRPDVFGPILFTLALMLVLRLTKPVYVKFKRRKTGFGTVFDAVTGKPIDLARIRLVDEHGLTTASAVTDKAGHYRLAATPGEYMVDVTKPGFTFPSAFVKARKISRTYDNVLPSSRIKIKDYGIVTKNIALDPTEGKKKRSNVFKTGIVLGDNLQLAIAYASPFVAGLYPYLIRTSIAPWIVYGAYVVLLVYRLTHFTPAKPPFGIIADAKTGKPLGRVVVRLFDGKFNKLLKTEKTSEKGRYAFLVNRGAYYMTLQKEGYKKMRLNFPNITKDSYPLATNVKMKKSGG
jgi:hypothetical protein